MTTTRSARSLAARNTATWSSSSITQRRVQGDRNPQVRKLTAEPLAVGVERLATDELAADRNDFSPHGSFLLLRLIVKFSQTSRVSLASASGIIPFPSVKMSRTGGTLRKQPGRGAGVLSSQPRGCIS